VIKNGVLFYFARCVNIIFNSLLRFKYDVYTHSQNKIHMHQFLSHIIIILLGEQLDRIHYVQ